MLGKRVKERREPRSVEDHSLPNCAVGDMSVHNPIADMAPTCFLGTRFRQHNSKTPALSGP